MEHAQNQLALREGQWKVIEKGKGPRWNPGMGNGPTDHLYNPGEDLGETKNLAAQNPEKVKEAIGHLGEIRQNPDGRP